LQSGGNKGIPGFNLQREIPWTESTVRWTSGTLGSMVDRGRRGHWARRRLASARELGLAGAHRWGATGRGGHGELDGLLTGARAAVWWPGDGGEERWWLELITRVKEGVNGLGREGKRCGEVRGWCLPFIGAEVEPGRGGLWVTMALMSLMPLKTVRLRGGLRRGS
jgi:hypothetical protein